MNANVVITGLGAVSRAGYGTGPLLRMIEQSSAASPENSMPANWDHSPGSRHLSRTAAAFAAAAEEAWRDAGLPERLRDGWDAAIVEGSSLGPLPDALAAARTQRRARPSDLLRYMPGAGGAHFAQQHAVEGSVLHVSAASVSGAVAIIEGARLIRTGAAKLVVVGAADCPLQPEVIDRFRAAGLLAQRHCRPYSRQRTGTVLAEAAGVLILEDAQHAASRGAFVHGRLCAAEVTTESHAAAAPDPTGAGVARTVTKVLAAIGPQDIGWIKGHGTGTIKGDAAECAGLYSAFGVRLRDIPITGMKSVIGHSLGASGAVECVAALLAAQHGFVPATAGGDHPDRDLPAIDLVTQPRAVVRSGMVLMLAQSFGGRCTALAVRT